MTSFTLLTEGPQKGVLQSEIVAAAATITADEISGLVGAHQFAGVELFSDAAGTPANVGAATGTVNIGLTSPVSPQHEQTPTLSTITLGSYQEASWDRPISGIEASITSPSGFTHWRLNIISYPG